MNSRELVIHALLGAPVSRYPCGPLAVHYTAALSHVSLREYTLNPDTLADCVTRYYESFRPDAVWVSADTWVTAEAMGAEVGFPGPEQPMSGTGRRLIRSAADIDKIPPAGAVLPGRCLLMCKALSKVKKRLGKEVFCVGCFDQSPFSLACALMGAEPLMMKAMEDAPFVEALLERCVDYAEAYAVAMARAGADMLSTGDSMAGLIGRPLYQRFAVPAQRALFERIRGRCDALLSLHICGNAVHILDEMAASGCDVLEIDARTDMERCLQVVSPTIALWGNIDPVGVLEEGTPEQVRQEALRILCLMKEHGRTRFVLSSGCTLTPGTPAENLHALIETARDFGV